MRTARFVLALTAGLTAAISAQAQDRPADRMAGMQMSGPMSMGLPLSPMPSVYAGQAD